MAKAKSNETNVETKDLMRGELNLLLKNATKFVDFLEKFKTYNNNMTIDFEEDTEGNINVISKIATASASSAKFVKLKFSDLFDIVTGELPKKCRLNIYNVERLVNVFKLVKTENVHFNITYEEDEKDSNLFYIEECYIINSDTNYLMPYAEKKLIGNFSTDSFNKLFNINEYYCKLLITKDNIDYLSSWGKVDTGNISEKEINLNVSEEKNRVIFKGADFQWKYNGTPEIKSTFKMNFKAEHLKYLDKNDYNVYVKEGNHDRKNLIFVDTNNEYMVAIVQAPDHGSDD